MHDPQLLLEQHRHEAGAQQRAAEHERSAKLGRRAARMERWADRSQRISERLAATAKTRRLRAS